MFETRPSSVQHPTEHRFNPYEMNGGTIVGVAGEDFAVVASDTRLSEGYSILSRDNPHLYQVLPKTVMGSVGFHGDCITFNKTLQIRLRMYEYENNKKASTPAVAQLVSTMLYSRRFFPYYVNTIIAGLTNDGQGCVYSYDPVGSYEREVYRAGGSSAALIQPLLDSQLGQKNQGSFELNRSYTVKMSKEEVVALVKDIYTSATERDIYTGDAVFINVITKDGVVTEHFKLRRD
ncbi:proteasome subunit beta type-1 [Brachionus plicatilis]|uniref:Proteasome subunit beta type-1 n=1 Tax=Brachionus plicatilis TaxID=10195 RepID=A0A3M7RUH8_BRAPC|nr:proteasome subunit beta type-1 [Brachionus plicatilis]